MEFTVSPDLNFWIRTCKDETKQTKLASWLPLRNENLALLAPLMKTTNTLATKYCLASCGPLEPASRMLRHFDPECLVDASVECLQVLLTHVLLDVDTHRLQLIAWVKSIISTIPETHLALICAYCNLTNDEQNDMLAELCNTTDVATERLLFTKKMFTLVDKHYPSTALELKIFKFVNSRKIYRHFNSLSKRSKHERFEQMLQCSHTQTKQHFFDRAVDAHALAVADWLYSPDISFNYVDVPSIFNAFCSDEADNHKQPNDEVKNRFTNLANVLDCCRNHTANKAPDDIDCESLCFVDSMMEFYDNHCELKVPTNFLYAALQQALLTLEAMSGQLQQFILRMCIRSHCPNLVQHLLKFGASFTVSTCWESINGGGKERERVYKHIWTYRQSQVVENAAEFVCAAVCTRNIGLWKMLVAHADALLMPLIRADSGCEFLDFIFYHDHRLFQLLWPLYSAQQQGSIVEEFVKHALHNKGYRSTLLFFNAQKNIRLSDGFLTRNWSALGASDAFCLIVDWMKRTEVWKTHRAASRKIAIESLSDNTHFKTLWKVVPEIFGNLEDTITECLSKEMNVDYRVCLYLIRKDHVSFDVILDTFKNQSSSLCRDWDDAIILRQMEKEKVKIDENDTD